MIIVLQRTSEAHVAVNKKVISEVKKGLVLLVGVYKGDDFLDADKAVDKIINLRIFSDQDGKMNLSIHFNCFCHSYLHCINPYSIP